MTDLPYGGTAADYRREAAGRAAHAELRFAMLLHPRGGPLTEDAKDAATVAAYAATDAWSVVALLRHVGDKYGPDAMTEAAAIAQESGYDGNPALTDDLAAVDLLQRPNPLLTGLAAAWALVDAQRAMLDRYAASDNEGRTVLWRQLHDRGDQLHDILTAMHGGQS